MTLLPSSSPSPLHLYLDLSAPNAIEFVYPTHLPPLPSPSLSSASSSPSSPSVSLSLSLPPSFASSFPSSPPPPPPTNAHLSTLTTTPTQPVAGRPGKVEATVVPLLTPTLNVLLLGIRARRIETRSQQRGASRGTRRRTGGIILEEEQVERRCWMV